MVGGVSADVEILLAFGGALLVGAFSLYMVGFWFSPNDRIFDGIEAVEWKQRRAALLPIIRGRAAKVVEIPGLHASNLLSSSGTVVRRGTYMTRFAQEICSRLGCCFW